GGGRAAPLARRSLPGALGNTRTSEFASKESIVEGTIVLESTQRAHFARWAPVILLSFSLLTDCAYRASVHTRDLESYRGDGVASKVHSLIDPGVRIEFEKFSLSKPYQAVYQLKALPLRPTPYFVDLVVASPGNPIDPHRPRGTQYGLPGELHLRLVDKWEFALREGSLFDYTWSPEEDGWSTESGRDHEDRFYVHAVAARLGTMIEPAAITLAANGHLVLEVSW